MAKNLTRKTSRQLVAEYIDYYNHRRLQEKLKELAPNQFRLLALQKCFFIQSVLREQPLKSYALEAALNHGKRWSGFKLVEGRSNRKFKDEAAVGEAAKAAGYRDIFRQSLITLTEMEKLMGKPKFSEILGDHMEKPPGKPALVPITDKRPEINTSAKHDFKEEITRRANLTNGTTQHKRVYSGCYALSGMVFCAHCGDIFRRIKWNNRGYKSIVWRCVSRVDKDGPDCLARTVNEERLHEVAVKAINEAFRKKENILPLLIENIESSLEENTADRIKAVDDQIKTLQQELLATATNKNSGDELGMEIRRLRNEKQAIQAEDASRQDLKKRIDELIAFLEDLPCELTEYDEQFVRTLIDKIIVFDNHFIVEFKSGIEIKI